MEFAVKLKDAPCIVATTRAHNAVSAILDILLSMVNAQPINTVALMDI